MDENKNPVFYKSKGAIGTAFAVLMGALILRTLDIGNSDVYPPDFGERLKNGDEDTFDFIIVGGGTSGCVLANRLSSYYQWKILLLEAGDYPSATSEVPAFFLTLLKTQEDWNFTAEPDPNYCQGTKDRTCRISRGKVLGGTSVIDNMHYLRGNDGDFEKWDALTNDWSPKIVGKAYDVIENAPPTVTTPVRYGLTGDIFLNNFRNKHPIKDAINKAVSDIINSNSSYSDGTQYFETLATVQNNTRYNMAKAFLSPAKERKNLFVAKNAYVLRVLTTDPPDKKASGVEVDVGGQVLKLKARKEVILSAGPINTPKILMLSGIGPEEHLKSLNISVLSNSKVGYNLQDHFGVPIFVGIDLENDPELDGNERIDAAYDYIMHRSGYFSNINIHDLVGFINTRESEELPKFPNIAIYHYYFETGDKMFVEALDGLNFNETIAKSLVKFNSDRPTVVFVPTLLNPKSRGRVSIVSADPYDSPKIEAGFLADKEEEDLADLISGYRYVTKLIESRSFKVKNPELLKIDIPNCRNFNTCTDAYLKCFIRSVGFSMRQVVGTARMGKLCDGNTVVDSTLEVKGLRGLRVVDGSVMPNIVSGNTLATVAMIGEKASTEIMNKWIKGYKQDKSSCPFA